MALEISLKLLLSILMYSSIVMVAFSMFRMTAMDDPKVIAVIGLSVGAANYYFKFIVLSQLFILISLMLFIVLSMILLRIPFLYSALMCITGLIYAFVVDMVVSMIFIGLHLTTAEELNSPRLLLFALMNISFILINTLTYLFLKRYKIGFIFIARKFHTSNGLKPHNFLWATVLIIGVAYAQFTIYNMDLQSMHFVMLIVMVLILFVILNYSYNQNKRHINDRFRR
ncbi:hypothetical protein [Ferviditalea candida]|uniref:Uncharacterized protein n=1 Tax=Ferviditalea candida TaxID=3108399 RepID=A0ABU5ZDP9_9BACL|nr:hypothetical protein [Paenibacillaceae bacterium T2]